MTKFCALKQAVGNDEECQRAWCPFWERGGAVIEPGCAIERLGLDLAHRDLAHYLLELRSTLEDERSAGESDRAREQLAAVLDALLVEVSPPVLAAA